MWATVRRYEGIKDTDEAGKRVREGFVPLMSTHRGFVAYYWVEAGDGVMISTSVFEDQRTRRIRALAGDFVKELPHGSVPQPADDRGGPCRS